MENQRTFVLGKVNPQRESLMKVALDANRAGLEAAVAGRPVSSIDAASQSMIAGAGFDDYVLHAPGAVSAWPPTNTRSAAKRLAKSLFGQP